MKIKILMDIHKGESKIILLLVLFVLFSELIKTKAEIYILEQSLELKLLLLSLVTVTMYKIPDHLIIFIIIFLLFLSLFGIQTGFMIYVFLIYAFLRLFKLATKT